MFVTINKRFKITKRLPTTLSLVYSPLQYFSKEHQKLVVKLCSIKITHSKMATPSQSQTIAIKRRNKKTVEKFTHNLNSSNRCRTTNEHHSNYANK